MKYLMKERWLSFGSDFDILDEHGKKRFFVDGKVLTIRDKLYLQDLDGNEIAFIRQRLLAWGPTYEILRNDTVVAIVKKHLFTLLHCRFFVDVPGPDDLEAKGNFWDHEYQFTLHGNPVAQVSKQWLTWTDHYVIDVADGQDDILILACAVVIDMACHEKNKHGG